jgi:hypothetical protein
LSFFTEVLADHLLEAAFEAALEDAKAPLSPEARKVGLLLMV